MRNDCTIDDYLNAAADRIVTLYNLPKPLSDRELARRIGVGKTTLHHYRTKRSLPDDTVMVTIAEKAGENIEVALMHLSAWRAEEPARSVYAAMASRLGRSAAAIFCAGLCAAFATLILHPSTAHAASLLPGTDVAQGNLYASAVYIMENI